MEQPDQTKQTKTIRSKTVHIGGMSCISCQNKIEEKLRATPGIVKAEVNYETGKAQLEWDTEQISLGAVAGIIEKLGYTAGGNENKQENTAYRAAGMIIAIVALFMLVRQFGFSTFTGGFILAEAGMGYGMLFIIGLITSVHCVAMCGGINLSQCIPHTETVRAKNRLTALIPGFLYNAGRVASYTAVGFIVGALGSGLSFSNTMKGIVQLIAGVFMVIMGINMLGIFPFLRKLTPRLPKVFTRKIEGQKAASKSPLFIGLLNGLMPCGPLQAMQIYALSTGSPVKGAISMLLFSLGTVPLMFALGALSALLSGRFTRRVMTVGAVVVAVMGLSMFSYGWSLSGFPSPVDAIADYFPSSLPANGTAKTDGGEYRIENGIQLVNSTLQGGRYPAITVQAGIPVKWTINAPQGNINGCNNRMIIRDFGIEHRFTAGENIIEFTPAATGKVRYSCWMGMIRSSINVVEDIASGVETETGPDTPVPAGYVIPTGKTALATIQNGLQTVTITVTDEGIEPALVILQEGVNTEWTIENISLDSGSAELIFPAYATKVPIDNGGNSIYLRPQDDFDFSTADNIFYGYVKVVPDINNVNIAAIKKEVSEFETLIYPESYFEDIASGAGCH